MDRRHAEPATAAGARSTPTTTYYYLNNIPFADHGALLDPPTEDVTRALRLDAGAARRHGASTSPARRARRSTICASTQRGRQLVRPLGHELHLRHLVGAVRAQRRRRRPRRARDPEGGGVARRASRTRMAAGARTAPATSSIIAATSAAPSTASQTAWALLGLMAAGEVDHPAVAARHRLSRAQRKAPTALLEGGALHRDRLPARVLSALPRLPEILPALGAGALPQLEARQCARGGVRDVVRTPSRNARRRRAHGGGQVAPIGRAPGSSSIAGPYDPGR